MTPLFRCVLVIASLGTLAVILGRIRKAKLSIEDSMFWILMSLMFVLFALFPVVPDTLAALLGIYSTANFLFLFMIFVLLLKMFSMSMHIAQLEERLKTLVQKLALSEAEARAGENGRGSLPASTKTGTELRARTAAEASSSAQTKYAEMAEEAADLGEVSPEKMHGFTQADSTGNGGAER